MARPVTLFTGQWADLPFEQMCAKAQEFGYDGLELACWGDHFDVDQALKDKNYCKRRWETLRDHGLDCYSVSSHLVGQAICDNIDSRHKAILPPDVWGDGEPEGVRKRAARKMIDTGKACRKLMDARPDSGGRLGDRHRDRGPVGRRLGAVDPAPASGHRRTRRRGTHDGHDDPRGETHHQGPSPVRPSAQHRRRRYRFGLAGCI